MLTLPGSPRLFLCQHPVSMRKSFEGLSAQVELLFPGELLTGAFFIFLNRKQDHMKVLYWDTDGLAIWFKRLEKGSFPKKRKEQTRMTRREFFMLLEGVTPKRLQPRFSL
jgi:transposase